MKRFSVLAAAFVISLMTLCTAASAANSLEITSWSGDYSEMKLSVEVKSLVDYVQRVSAVMYKKGDARSIENYARAGEITLSARAAGTVEFNIADDLSAPNGEYTIYLHGGGYLGTSATCDVVVTPPKDDLLAEFNRADAQSIDACVTKGNLPLRLNAGSEPRSTVRLSMLLSIRKGDYNNAFKSLEDVKDAWTVSAVLEYLAGDNADGIALKQKTEAVSALVGIDKTQATYKSFADTVYKNLAGAAANYNNGAGITSGTELKTAFDEYLALNIINAASWDDIETDLAGCYKMLHITAADYASFTSLNLAQRQKVLRQIHDKSFTAPADIKTAFDGGLANALSPDPTPDPQPEGGGGGGGSKKNTAYGITSGESTESAGTAASANFKDCPAAHWANGYVTALREKNIINGYPDGNFYPENKVTREEFVKLIISAAGLYKKDAVCDFTDVNPDEWYYVYVASATEASLVNGMGDGAFGAGRTITREDAAVISAGVLGFFNKHGAQAELTFADNADISEYAKESVKILCGAGILNGYEDNTLRPKASLTRAETAKLICMLRELI